MIEMPLLFVADVRCRAGRDARDLEGVLQHAVDPDAGHHRLLDHDLAVGPLEDAAADAGVLALGVLADDEEVDVTRHPTRQRAGHARDEAARTEVDVLVERGAGTASRDPHSDTWSGTTSGHPTAPKKIASKPRSALEPVVGEHRAGADVVVGAREVELARARSGRRSEPATSPSTRIPSGTTSWPMPSPGMTAMRCGRAMGSLSSQGRGGQVERKVGTEGRGGGRRPRRSSTSRGSGEVSVQTWVAFQQRVRKRQPDGGSTGLGTSPVSTIRSRERSTRGSGIGTADSRACV